MWRIILVVFLVTVCGCVDITSVNMIPPIEYSVKGYSESIDGNRLLITDLNNLKVIGLSTKKVVATVTIPSNYGALGFDIYGDTIVWSDLRNENTHLADGEIEKSNVDVFAYNIRTKQLRQLTKDKAAQMNPKIWRNYVLWQDNRNDLTKDYPGKWGLCLYDLNTGREKWVSSTLAVHATYNIHDYKVVWEDERNFTGDNILRGGDNLPQNNKDIYLYDIKTEKETAIATGPRMECKPDIFNNYVVWEDWNIGKIEADIVAYNIKTKEKRNITDDDFNQGDPKIYDNYIVWMDERRGISTNDVYINGKAPNSDIFLYDLKAKKVKRMTGDEVQIQPEISSDWLVYILSRQINPQVQAVRYK